MQAPPSTGSRVRQVPRRAFSINHRRGYWWLSFPGWELRIKNTLRHLSNFEERLGRIPTLKIGRFWLMVTRVRKQKEQ